VVCRRDFYSHLRASTIGTLPAITRSCPAPPGKSTIQEIDMSKLTINDLTITKELDKQQMTSLLGGMGRTPQQILAWEITGKPATWQGLVLGDDNQLHVPTI
jgi:natural product precursor